MVAHILLLDSDADWRAEMARYLGQNGYIISEAADVARARGVIECERIDLLILDVALPGESGLSLCRDKYGRSGPLILIVSSESETIDRVIGLELGADVYLAKPLALRELLARVRALLRRPISASLAPTKTTFEFAGFRFEPAKQKLESPTGDLIALTPGELNLLSVFVVRPQTVHSREALATFMGGQASARLARGIDVQVSRLRRKLREAPGDPVIQARRGLGYAFMPSVQSM